MGANMNLKRTIIGLMISGALLIISAVSGILSALTDSHGEHITYYSNNALRIPVFVVGAGLFYLAWYIRTRPRWGWWVCMVEWVLGWIGFCIGGAYAVAAEEGGGQRSNSRGLLLQTAFCRNVGASFLASFYLLLRTVVQNQKQIRCPRRIVK
jgi:hypothetical protein